MKNWAHSEVEHSEIRYSSLLTTMPAQTGRASGRIVAVTSLACFTVVMQCGVLLQVLVLPVSVFLFPRSSKGIQEQLLSWFSFHS